MSKNKKRFFGISYGILIFAYLVLTTMGMLDFKSSCYVLVIIFLQAIVFVLYGYLLKRKIEQMKTDLGVVEDLTLDEL